MQKIISHLKNIFLTLILSLAVIYTAIYLMLSIQGVQNMVRIVAERELSQLLETDISIRKVGIKPFNKITLMGVLLKDQQQDTLFYTNKISAGANLIPLFKRKVEINTIQLIGFNARINRIDPADATNIQFLIDALSRKQVDQELSFTLKLNTILFNRGEFRYDIHSERPIQDGFDKNHIHISDLAGNIRLRHLSKDSLNTEIKRLELKEKSGLHIRKIALHLTGNKEAALLDHFFVEMPHSKIEIDSLRLSYPNIQSKNDFVNQLKFSLNKQRATIVMSDLAAFAPKLKHFSSPIHIETQGSGSINEIVIPQLSLSYDNALFLHASGSLLNLLTPHRIHFTGDVSQFDIQPEGINSIIENLSGNEHQLPKTLQNLGKLQFEGAISGNPTLAEASGRITSQLGTVQTNMLFGKDSTNQTISYKGSVNTDRFELGKLLDKTKSDLDQISLNISLDGIKKKGVNTYGALKGEIRYVDFKEYRYEHIVLNGRYSEHSFDGSIVLDDPNGKFALKGKFESANEATSFNFTANADSIRLDRLKLAPKYEESALSFRLNANFVGNQVDNVSGDINLDSLSFYNNEEHYFLENLHIVANNKSSPQLIRIASDQLSAQLKGTYSFKSLIQELRSTLSKAVPSLATKQEKRKDSQNNFEFSINVADTRKLSKVLNTPFQLNMPATISGHYNHKQGVLYTQGEIPEFKIGNQSFDEGALLITMPDEQLQLRVTARKLNKTKDPLILSLNSEAQNGVITTRFDWSNLANSTFCGNFSVATSFKQQTGRFPLRTEIKVLPSKLIFNDTIWRVNQSFAVVDSGRIQISKFQIDHGDQYIRLNGALSKKPVDSLHLNLQDVNLDYIFETLNLENILFGGQGTGDFLLTHNEESPVLKTNNFHVKQFSYNRCVVGDIDLYSDWDNKNKGIYLKGVVTQPDAKPTIAEGTIFIGNDSLWLNFDANRLKVDFVQIWTDTILQNLSGRASGNLSLFGKFKELNIVGGAYTENVSFGIEYLNTIYTLSDSIHFNSNGIQFNNISLYDRNGNYAVANGRVNYKYFNDISYDVSMMIPNNQNFLLLNLTEKNNPVYWGTIYGSGSARIHGDVSRTWIDVSVRTNGQSRFFFSLNDNLTADDYQFLSFRNKDLLLLDRTNTMIAANSTPESALLPERGNEIFLDLQVEATPDAQINLIMDPMMGDMMKGTGNGNIRLAYSKATDFKLYGNYTINKGSYYFNLQDLIMRDFVIRPGSTVTFRGEPLNAELNIGAAYQVTANLTDLDESFAQSRELSRTNVPVQCILNIHGDLQSPDLSFDVNLPTVSQDIDRQVKSLVNTDDMMKRQILYLMVLNRFYTPDNGNTGQGNQQNRYSELTSMASSTLSQQFSNLLGQISDNWNIGTNIRSDKGDFSDVEVQLALSSQLLNNRLLFNGNLGNRNDGMDNNSFAGDFDMEYLLTPAGTLRLKAYNHYNDRNYSVKSALTTQGVGILFKKDFNLIRELKTVFRKLKARDLKMRDDEEIHPLLAE